MQPCESKRTQAYPTEIVLHCMTNLYHTHLPCQAGATPWPDQWCDAALKQLWRPL